MARNPDSSDRLDSESRVRDGASTSRTTSTVVGLFRDRDDAERAIRALRDAGFADRQIGVAHRDAGEQRELIDATGASGEGVKKGAVSGGIIGGLAGLLGSLLIPGLGPIVVAGWLGSTLVGAGVGAATGGLIGGLIDLGVSEDEAHHFEKGIHAGGVLVTVDAGARAHEAYELLHANGADLGPEGMVSDAVDTARSTGRNEASATMGAASTQGGSWPLQARRLQLREDRLRSMKDRAANDARLRQRVVTDQERREQAQINRTGISGEGSGRTFDTSDASTEAWRGNERRFRDDMSYSGPERRTALR